MQLDGGRAGSIRASADAPVPRIRRATVAEKPRPKRVVTKPVKLARRESDDADDRWTLRQAIALEPSGGKDPAC